MMSYFLGSVVAWVLLATLSVPSATLGARVCTMNGEVIACESFATESVALKIAAFVFSFFVLTVFFACAIFWIGMVIHVLTTPIENKAIWVLLMVFTGIVGAIAYYFLAKRPYDERRQPQAPGSSTVNTTPPNSTRI